MVITIWQFSSGLSTTTRSTPKASRNPSSTVAWQGMLTYPVSKRAKSAVHFGALLSYAPGMAVTSRMKTMQKVSAIALCLLDMSSVACEARGEYAALTRRGRENRTRGPRLTLSSCCHHTLTTGLTSQTACRLSQCVCFSKPEQYLSDVCFQGREQIDLAVRHRGTPPDRQFLFQFEVV